MSAYAKLPALLRRIDALESGKRLCRRRDCYGQVGLFGAAPFCGFCQSSFAMRAEFRLSMALPPSPLPLSPFVAITAC